MAKHHHHRAGEMAHHKAREAAKSAHRSKKAGEHNLHASMTEHHHGVPPKALAGHNSLNHDNHQEGIARKLQRPGDMEVGEHGKMMVHEHYKKSHKE